MRHSDADLFVWLRCWFNAFHTVQRDAWRNGPAKAQFKPYLFCGHLKDTQNYDLGTDQYARWGGLSSPNTCTRSDHMGGGQAEISRLSLRALLHCVHTQSFWQALHKEATTEIPGR